MEMAVCCLARRFASVRPRLPWQRGSGIVRRVDYLDVWLGPFGQDVLGHREYSPREYADRLRRLGLQTVDICGYNFKVALTPLDKWMPRFSIGLTSKLEVLARTPLRFMGTSFIIKARKV